MTFNLTKKDLYIMGIVNFTPDSFYDGGKYKSVDDALKSVELMIEQGADIIDIGGESSRPGSKRISIQQEIDRVAPVVSKVRENFDIPISVDTMKPELLEVLIPYNVNMVNDISSLSNPGLINIIKDNDMYICIMHMQKNPEEMQINPAYNDVNDDVTQYLDDKMNFCISNGISREKIIIDPGFGFGKTLDHNYSLLNNLDRLLNINQNILVGISRKSMIGNLLNKDVNDRLYGSLAATVISIINKAKIIRTHDVRETKIAADLTQSIIGAI